MSIYNFTDRSRSRSRSPIIGLSRENSPDFDDSLREDDDEDTYYSEAGSFDDPNPDSASNFSKKSSDLIPDSDQEIDFENEKNNGNGIIDDGIRSHDSSPDSSPSLVHFRNHEVNLYK